MIKFTSKPESFRAAAEEALQREGLYTLLPPSAPMECDFMLDDYFGGQLAPNANSELRCLAMCFMSAVASLDR